MLKDNEKHEHEFLGGVIVIKAPGSFKNDEGVTKNYNAKVDLSKVVDKNGCCSPRVFLNLVQSTLKDKEVVEILTQLSTNGSK